MRNDNKKIAICGGHQEADYIISCFANIKKDLVVINGDPSNAKELSDKYGINVLVGEGWDRHYLEEANIHDFDILITLDRSDSNNFVTCLLAKKLFNVKKCICIVNNPNNVEVFKEIGIDVVICSVEMLADSIKNESNVEDVVKTLSLERGKIGILENVVLEGDYVANKKIMELGFPKDATIACIYRKPNVIIPNGQTTIRLNDKLTIVTQSANIEFIKKFVKEGNVTDEENI